MSLLLVSVLSGDSNDFFNFRSIVQVHTLPMSHSRLARVRPYIWVIDKA